MKKKLERLVLAILLLVFKGVNGQKAGMPRGIGYEKDWLVQTCTIPVEIIKNNKDIVLDNGLVRRTFRVTPNLTCYDLFNYTSKQQLIRSVKPEAYVFIDGTRYAIGGLKGQTENGYFLPQWLDNLTANDSDFVFASYDVQPLQTLLPLKAMSWPYQLNAPKGKQILFRFTSAIPKLKNFEVVVHYQVYQGLPLIEKWVTIENNTQQVMRTNQLVNEVLGVVEEESAVVGTEEKMRTQHGIYVETNYAFNNSMSYRLSDQTTHWNADSTYTSQVNYGYKTPCLLEVHPKYGPEIDLGPGENMESVHSFELLMDSYDRQRRGMAIRKMYRCIAPWVVQNPIFMHLVSRNDEEVKNAIDQCVATGYEAVIVSFGSNLNMEDSSPANIKRWKDLADYAHQKKILLGGYSLFSSRHINDDEDVIDPNTGKPGAFFGHAPCFGSNWGLSYRNKIKYFFEQTGFDIWENDGPYPGDRCASTKHPGHRDVFDSQWKQMQIQKELYHWLNERAVYINAPDWYILDGTHKLPLGYREVNFSLSRHQQKILNRQNIYDGTQEKTSSMGWGFVPLTKYHGGDSTAVLEPLSEHLYDYEQLMMQYYGAGVQACYRGPRIYDTEATRLLVQKTIQWYKQHRNILNADIIHLRRADGRDWDGYLHVDPNGKEKAFVMLFNPLKQAINKSITIPLYYTGIQANAKFIAANGSVQVLSPDKFSEVKLKVNIPAESYQWFSVE